jgi:hypothetical protein
MKRVLTLGFMVIAMMFAGNALAQQTKANKLKIYGDVRFRTELDRDSKKSNGDMRADRDRFRFRFRFGVKYTLNENFEFGGRIRSGNADNAQSPHVTIGDGFNSKDLSIDKAYIKFKKGNFYVSVGKNSMNMWEPDEMLWDGDVNPEGIALGNKFKIGDNSKLAMNAGYFILNNNTVTEMVDGKPVSKQTFGKHSNAAFGQMKFCTKIGDNKLILAPGMLRAYTEQDLGINYQIFSTFVQFKMKNGFNINFDYFMNMEDYEGKVDPAYEDQKTGMSVTAGYPLTSKLSAKVSYAQVQKYAVIDMFAQDDWMRWGNNTMTRSSNYGGFGVVLKYKVAKNMNTQLKYWNVTGLKKGTGHTDLETGSRIRLDFNIKF